MTLSCRLLTFKLKIVQPKVSKMQSIQRNFLHTTSPAMKIVPKNLKGKSKSSQEWITRQLNDPYVKKAQDMNYRARSAFKLIEMDDKIKILKPGLIVVECGAAPGAWTQVIVQRINSDRNSLSKPQGKVIGIDLLSISPIPGAILLPGCDFTTAETQQKIQDLLNLDLQYGFKQDEGPCGLEIDLRKESKDKLIDIVLSDMAPNATGMRDMDHPRIIKLVRSALKFAVDNGKAGGHFLTKIWDGGETKNLEEEMSQFYHKVIRLKPPCSRNDSAELFLFAKSKR